MKYLNRKIVIVLGIMTVIVVLFSVLNPKKPKLVSSYPKDGGSLSDFRAPITLQFDRQVNPADFTFTLSPEEKFNIATRDRYTINLNFVEPLRVQTKYDLKVSYRKRDLLELNFSTPETQRDLRFNLQVKNDMDAKYPLMSQTPYETSFIKTEYSDVLTLKITLKNPEITSAEAIELVKKWVAENGGDPNAHKYIIAVPSSPTN